MSAVDPISILLVDDELILVKAIARAVRDAGLEVRIATSGQQALVMLDERVADVLVSDIDMPGMSGIELVREARRRHPAMLRILLTGGATLERAIDAINEGEVLRLFNKPFDLDKFMDTITGLADRIARLREAGEQRSRDVRRVELHRWVEARFPGTLGTVDANATSSAGKSEVVLDVPDLIAALEAAPAPEAAALLRRSLTRA